MENSNHQPNIEIKTVIIDTKKLTKSIFIQLGDYHCLDNDLVFVGDRILGYVNHGKMKYLLWVKNGLLRRTGLDDYRKILYTSSDTFVYNIEWFLRLTRIDFHVGISAKGTVRDSIEDPIVLFEKIDKLRIFLKSIKDDMQIFL